ncbi:oxidoreductase molybdopterin binding protein [Candidatus Scalindua japonica]|uniref:Oxidoreductase molybdopterin binding protein n=2 Tax=Candidatus Scalindua japonica TaxID=1284222 RepID=A0A286U3C0_9BACT|nr:oxidoreductase molybdopterin binding protein [Candidatus Scalindua japonica]
MPEGLIPIGIADAKGPIKIPDKHPDLSILSNLPINMETPPHLLDDEVTPAGKMFVRNSGHPPENPDPNSWTLTIEGESAGHQMSFTIDELKEKFKHYTYQIQIECGGNGRSEFRPRVKGLQWTYGAVSCASWTGARLKDVLAHVGVRDDAVYIGYYGADTHLSRDPDKVVISRGVPIEKAMEDESLIAFAMNGQDIPYLNGYPLRLVTGGWPGSTCGKWLRKIEIRNRVHDGKKMRGKSYRVPTHPVARGKKVANENMRIIESMPVKSIITFPRTQTSVNLEEPLELRGHAWAGDLSVSKMHLSIDFGATWIECKLTNPVNRLAWQRWFCKVRFAEKGYYEVWAKATDSNGRMQPMVVPGWNPKGYLNNSCHRIALYVT